MCHEYFGGASRPAIRWALVGAATILMAGCSSDLTRFGEGGSSSSSRVDLTPTASIPSGGSNMGSQAQAAEGYSPGATTLGAGQPVSKIVSQPLSAPNPRFSAAATPSPTLSRPAISAPVSTSSIATPAANMSGWKAEGGTPIVVAQGESAGMLASRYGVPADALLKVNGFTSASQIQPGARLVVPVYNAAGSSPRVAHAPAAATPIPTAAPKPEHVAQPRPTAPAPVQTAAAKPAKEKLNFVPGPAAKPEKVAKLGKPAEAKPVAAAKPATPAKVAAAPKPVKDKVAQAKKPAADVDHETQTASLPPTAAVASAAPPSDGDSDKPEFRWPARGRIIQGFKAGGNDGINIALPEGTSVKATEGGIVKYAGNELKGYGNLVLIQHPNGYVSAYANNGELAVKRGEQVKRGQMIAKSGQSGNVASPQLHFELRKGATPVDPTGYLAGL